ncbi:MAG TPA: S41 family peptidase [Micromonosporaceae bacterium]
MNPVNAGYLRFPSIQGEAVVFCCEDDLWLVDARGGPARRLTAGVSEASYPRLSPDGRQVAFVGADDGPTEVYVMPRDGGPARRLTYQAARCVVTGWHPGTGEIVYASTAEQPAGFGFRLFAVHPAGGPPRLLRYGPANALSFGPDGGAVLGRNGTDPARWKRYRGGAVGELWIDRTGDGVFDRLVPLPGNLANPCWVGERVYFVSDHEGFGDVYSCRVDGTDLIRHTRRDDYYARTLSGDGHRLVYHAGGALYLLDPATDRHERLDVRLASSRTQRGRRFVPADSYLDSVQLSPDGNSLAVTARGKPFTMDHWSGAVRQHGTPHGVRYRLLSWLGDGRRLVAVAADERPDEWLAVLPADGSPGETEVRLGDIGCVTELAASPTSGLVAFATNRQELRVVDTDSAVPVARLLDRAEYERIEDLTWSPDGRWLAYTFPDTPRSSAIKLAEPATGRTWQLTRPVLRDCRPVFDPTGRYLYFIGQRQLTPEHDQVEFAVGFPFGARPYLMTLRADEPSPFVARPGPPEEEPDQPPTGEPVEIDLDGIERRIVPFPVPESRYAGIVGLRGKVLLLSVPPTAADPLRPEEHLSGTVTLVDLLTTEVTPDYLTGVDDLGVNSGDCGVLLYRSGDKLRVIKAGTSRDDDEYGAPDSKPGRESGWIDLDRVKVPLLPAAEWRQMFREAWRLQRESFWSADMAGVDWQGVYRRYRPLADLVATRSELSDLLWELQGELGTSHAYERGGEYRRPPHHAQGFLGVDWEVSGTAPDGAAVWRIARILEGDPWDPEATSPCNRLGTDIRPGDTIVAVNGRPVGPEGPGELLVGQANREVELTVARDGVSRQVTVRAVGDESRARYRDWVERNRRYVRCAAHGRLGYIHVPDMFATGYAEFVRAFLRELDREGLIVDVRFNGGGHVSPLLLERLARSRVGAEHGRWSGVLPYPLEAPRGPMVALVNEQTGSDGEIFSHAFRSLGLGVLVGRRTWGGVVATWPRHPLVDGTVTTQPEFRYYLRGVQDGLENHGVEPDVDVDMAPQDYRLDEDLQLAAAVRHLLDLLDGCPRPLPDQVDAADLTGGRR